MNINMDINMNIKWNNKVYSFTVACVFVAIARIRHASGVTDGTPGGMGP